MYWAGYKSYESTTNHQILSTVLSSKKSRKTSNQQEPSLAQEAEDMEQVVIHLDPDLVVEREPDPEEELFYVEEAVQPKYSQRARKSRAVTSLTNDNRIR